MILLSFCATKKTLHLDFSVRNAANFWKALSNKSRPVSASSLCFCLYGSPGSPGSPNFRPHLHPRSRCSVFLTCFSAGKSPSCDPWLQFPEILTKKQAAELLKTSTRQLDRLPIRKSYAIGPRSPRYFRDEIIAFMQLGMREPFTARTALGKIPSVSRRGRGGSGAEWLRARLAALK